jgi:hypothetical protein
MAATYLRAADCPWLRVEPDPTLADCKRCSISEAFQPGLGPAAERKR